MANVNRPQGFRPIGNMNGANWTGKTNMYLVPAADGTACFIGDLVKPYTAGGAAGTVVNGIDVEGLPTVIQSAAGDPSIGVVVGFLPDFSDLTKRHRVASTNRIALVCDDPNTLYEIQEIGGGTAFTTTEVGLNANMTTTVAGSATTGMSGMQIDSATDAVTAGLNMRLIGLVKRPDNNYGDFAKWVVMLMNRSYAAAVAGV